MTVDSPAPVLLRLDDRRPEPEANPASRFVGVAADARPRLSWTVPLVRDAQKQTGYEIRIAPDGVDPRDAAPHELTWTSGEVTSATSTWLRPGVDLPAHGRWTWTVRCRDEHGRLSVWAQPAVIETGPFTAADWDAHWLGAPSTSTLAAVASLPATPLRARLHVSAQGVYRASIGGTVVNPGTAEPARTDPARALCRTYDVTDLVRAGRNDVEIVLGAGHWASSGHEPRLLAELVVTLPDGTLVRHGTGPGWRLGGSEVVVDEAFYVERHDRHAAPRPVTADAQVLAHASAPGKVPLLPPLVAPDPAPPIRVVSEWSAVELPRPRPGVRVFDVGVNIAGRSRLRVSGPLAAGTEITLVHGELLHPGGGVDTTNLKMPYDTDRHRQSVEYVASGRPGEEVEAWFAFHGFRYVQVDGLPEDAGVELTGLALHSDLAPVATFESDDPTLDRLVAAATRTQLNNAHGIPEDCPTREQSGWTGDAAATTDLALAHLDMAGFYRKWLGDLATSQRPDGALPAIAPSLNPDATPPDPVWGSALQRVLLGHWHHYGDPGVVATYIGTLRRWVDYQLGLVRDGVVSEAPISYGHDWLGLEQTPPPMLHTGAALDAVDSLAELEEAVGEAAAATLRRRQAAELRASARAAFHSSAGAYWANGSQGSMAVAVAAGLTDPDEADELAQAIEDDVRRRGNRVSTGFAATSTLVRVLAAAGRSQVLADVVGQPAQPGVGAMLVDGPGTLWESWWIDPDNTGTGSLDHIGLGGPFAGWVWTGLVGLRPTSAGFGTFTVAPSPVDGVGRAASTTETVRGTVRAGWRREGADIVVEVEVPVGASARIVVPGGADDVVGAGRHVRRGRWRATRVVTPPDERPFTAPARAPRAADVRGGGQWAAGVADGDSRASTAAFQEVDVLDHGLRCMPVHHAQLPGPVVRAVGRPDADPEVPLLLRTDFAAARDLSAAVFGYALVDLCLALPRGFRPDLVVRFHAADGSVREGFGRVWPAGWNRVAVDLADWPARSAVIAAEAGVWMHSDGKARSSVVYQPDAPVIPVAFHLGEIGWSEARRTW